MRIDIVAGALAGLAPDAVGAIAREAWLAKRPEDWVSVRLTSDGVLVDHVGTGLDAVFRAAHSGASSVERIEPRRITWLSGDGVSMVDLAEAVSYDGVGDPMGSSEFVADEILAAAESGARSLHLHVPRTMRGSDVGTGLLAKLSGRDLDLSSGREEIAAALSAARRRIGNLRIDVTYDRSVTLTGVNGMARAWSSAGFDEKRAQEYERVVGAFASEFSHAVETSSNMLSRPTVDHRSSFSGVGGGLGLVLAALGASISELGPFIRHNYWVPTGDDAELFVYVTQELGLDIPSSLSDMADEAARCAAPAVVIAGHAYMRRGELPRMGLHGLYDLGLETGRKELMLNTKGERAPDEASLREAGDLGSRLSDKVGKVARTWGWN